MPPELPFTTAFLLDIDVAATANLPKDWAGLLEKLAEMRTLKNDIFEAAISNKARKGFS
jgi:uncharacterized protein (TIGR04255 family)